MIAKEARAALANGPVLVSVEIEHETDTDPSTDYLGVYSSEPGPEDRTIDRQERGHTCGPREYRYFIAASSADETGNPESVKQDYERMEALQRGEWCMLGVIATAKVEYLTANGCRRMERFRSDGLWGVESDGNADYIREIENEQLDDLYEHLEHFGVDLSNWDALTTKETVQ